MSGYSPTWTSKGSDKLRALQVTKILMNALEKVILSIDVSQAETKEVLVNSIAHSINQFFTPNRDISLSSQYELLLEVLGWKIREIDESDDTTTTVNLGANRYIDLEIDNIAYDIMILGIVKALGFFMYEKDVIVELIRNQFDSSQIQCAIQATSNPIPGVDSIQTIDVDTSSLTSPITTKITEKEKKIIRPDESKAKKPQFSDADDEIKPTIEVKLDDIFAPILKGFPITTILPIFHKVLAEIVSSFFVDAEDNNVKKAKDSYDEKHVLYLIEFIIINALDTEQKISDIAEMIGKYVIKALQSQVEEDVTSFLPSEITSTISRRVSYIEFPARGYCTYAPGEKCVAGKRDLCDFVLFMWQGILSELIIDKTFKLGERIAATRRGKFCLAEFLKEEQ